MPEIARDLKLIVNPTVFKTTTSAEMRFRRPALRDIAVHSPGRWAPWAAMRASQVGTSGLEERIPEGSRVNRCLSICWEFDHG
jgi:hypothetical protein